MSFQNLTFIPNKYYLSDYAGYVAGPYDTEEEALAASVVGDLVFFTRRASSFKSIPKVTKITIDFNENNVTIEGAVATIKGVEYPVGTTALTESELNSVESFIDSAYSLCDNTVVKGTPPIKGENLDALLYM